MVAQCIKFVHIIKPTRSLISQICFWNKTLRVSDSSSVHHQGFFTVHTAMVYVCKPVWHIPLLCVQCKTPDDVQRNCPKHIEFYFKNKLEKLVHLVGFIIRILRNIWIFLQYFKIMFFTISRWTVTCEIPLYTVIAFDSVTEHHAQKRSPVVPFW